MVISHIFRLFPLPRRQGEKNGKNIKKTKIKDSPLIRTLRSLACAETESRRGY